MKIIEFKACGEEIFLAYKDLLFNF